MLRNSTARTKRVKKVHPNWYDTEKLLQPTEASKVLENQAASIRTSNDLTKYRCHACYAPDVCMVLE
jgi:hypothetical protein